MKKPKNAIEEMEKSMSPESIKRSDAIYQGLLNTPSRKPSGLSPSFGKSILATARKLGRWIRGFPWLLAVKYGSILALALSMCAVFIFAFCVVVLKLVGLVP